MSVREMKVYGSIDDMKRARAELGSPGTLGEAITATGIDALFVLLEGGTVEFEGRRMRLFPDGPTDEMVAIGAQAHAEAEGFISPPDDGHVAMRAALRAALGIGGEG